MKCIYCNQDCTPHSESVEIIDSSWWACNHHERKVIFCARDDNEEVTAIVMSSLYKDRVYEIQFYYPKYFTPGPGPDTFFDIFLVDKNEEVLSLNIHPTNVTPENVAKKLPTWLIFS